MAESSDFARRVFIEDVRSDGKYLRMTWHPELPGFIVSNWDGDVCVGATRVSVDAAPKLIQLLTNGMADALSSERAEPAAGTSASSRSRTPTRDQFARVRSSISWLLRRTGRQSSRHDEPSADLLDLSQHRARMDDNPRWSSNG